MALTLKRELRQRIYHHILFNETTRVNPTIPQDHRPPRNLVSLLLINRLIYREASAYFYGTAIFTATRPQQVELMIFFIERHMGVSARSETRLTSLGDRPHIKHLRIVAFGLQTDILSAVRLRVAHLVLSTLRYLRLSTLELFGLDYMTVEWMNSCWPSYDNSMLYDACIQRIASAHPDERHEMFILLFQLGLARVPTVILELTPGADVVIRLPLKRWLTNGLHLIWRRGRGDPRVSWVWNDKMPWDSGSYSDMIRTMRSWDTSVGPRNWQALRSKNLAESVVAIALRAGWETPFIRPASAARVAPSRLSRVNTESTEDSPNTSRRPSPTRRLTSSLRRTSRTSTISLENSPGGLIRRSSALRRLSSSARQSTTQLVANGPSFVKRHSYKFGDFTLRALERIFEIR
jgi:hypothetical protein